MNDLLPPPDAEGFSDYEMSIVEAVRGAGVLTILEAFANGATQTKIARELGITGSGLWRLFHRYGDDCGPVEKAKLVKRMQLWAEAKLRKADALADSVVDIADDAPETSEGIAKAKLRVDTRKWSAGVLNPKQYAQQNGTQVQVNISAQFLESLRKHGAAESLPGKRQQAIEDAEFTIERPSLLRPSEGDSPSAS